MTSEQEQRRNEIRIGLVLSDPDLTEAIVGGGAFGGAYSPLVAQNMFDVDHADAIEDAKRLVTVDEVGPRPTGCHPTSRNTAFIRSFTHMRTSTIAWARGRCSTINSVSDTK